MLDSQRTQKSYSFSANGLYNRADGAMSDVSVMGYSWIGEVAISCEKGRKLSSRNSGTLE